MSNGLVDLMQLYAEQNAKNDNSIKCVAGKIVAVTDDMFRADIELGQGQVVKDMMNKSGEKLKVGDTVWIEYFTYPSSGWIARRNGKPKPMGGGGGASTTIDTATVLTDENFHDFVIEEELMVDVVPPNRIYYGAHPSFCIVQGHYCLMSGGGISYDTETGKWTIGGIDGVYEKIIENKDKFGTQIGTQEGGGWLYYGSNVAYPSKYGCISCEIYRIENLSNGIRIQTLARRWTADTVEPSGNWWESEMTWGTLAELATTGGYFNQYLKAPDGSMYWTSTPKDIFIVPCVNFYNTPTSGSQSKRKHPYGYIVMNNYIVFASADGINYGVTQLMSTTNDSLLFACGALISEAENAFTLGISKRSEPVIDGGGD